MTSRASSLERLLERAAIERRQGNLAASRKILEDLVVRYPHHPGALNSLGLLCLSDRPEDASVYLERAASLDPSADILWLNLADAFRRIGDVDRELGAIDRILTRDPYQIAALVAKASIFERSGRLADCAAVHRALASAYPLGPDTPPELARVIEQGQTVIQKVHQANERAKTDEIASVLSTLNPGESQRGKAFVDAFFGRRTIYHSQPTGALYPFLPAKEFFDREQFPWLEKLETATDEILAELTPLWKEGADVPEPYVRFAPGQPVNQWAELNGSPRWGVYFLVNNGEPQTAHLDRCPKTAALIRSLPLLDQPGKSPTAMFSILQPNTHIPPHTGSTNVRATIHLPLVVPGGCTFRVGGERREWKVGEAWAFDDTIEHEAWNISDRPRAILILDAWNPYLSETERALVRATGA